MTQLDEYWPLLVQLLQVPEHCQCLYHGLYKRDGVKDTQVVQKVLPILKSIYQGEERVFHDFVLRCLSAKIEKPQDLALLLRSMLAWREFGETTDDDNRGFHHVNAKYFDSELATDVDEYYDNDEEGIYVLLEEAREMWANGKGPLWAGICVSFGSYMQPTRLWHYCEQRDIHDFYTDEYIKALASCIGTYSNIVEVGAGRGNLSKYLRPHVGAITATDSDDFEGVTQMTYQKALTTLSPDLVICSWMPYGEDWTPSFRSTESVKAYLLLGPPGVTATPSAWKSKEWEQERLEEVELYAVAKIDSPADPGNSKAVLWTKK